MQVNHYIQYATTVCKPLQTPKFQYYISKSLFCTSPPLSYQKSFQVYSVAFNLASRQILQSAVMCQLH